MWVLGPAGGIPVHRAGPSSPAETSSAVLSQQGHGLSLDGGMEQFRSPRAAACGYKGRAVPKACPQHWDAQCRQHLPGPGCRAHGGTPLFPGHPSGTAGTGSSLGQGLGLRGAPQAMGTSFPLVPLCDGTLACQSRVVAQHVPKAVPQEPRGRTRLQQPQGSVPGSTAAPQPLPGQNNC